MDLKLTTEQQVKVTIKPVSETGQPAKVDGAPTWEVASGECTVKAADDGLSAIITAADAAGDSEISVSADADLGSGVITITDAIRVTVRGPQAKALGLFAEDPTPKDEGTPGARPATATAAKPAAKSPTAPAGAAFSAKK